MTEILHEFEQEKPIFASEMNDNFNFLQNQIEEINEDFGALSEELNAKITTLNTQIDAQIATFQEKLNQAIENLPDYSPDYTNAIKIWEGTGVPPQWTAPQDGWIYGLFDSWDGYSSHLAINGIELIRNNGGASKRTGWLGLSFERFIGSGDILTCPVSYSGTIYFAPVKKQKG